MQAKAALEAQVTSLQQSLSSSQQDKTREKQHSSSLQDQVDDVQEQLRAMKSDCDQATLDLQVEAAVSATAAVCAYLLAFATVLPKIVSQAVGICAGQGLTAL